MRRGVTNVKKERKAPEATITAMLPVEDHVYSTGWQARPDNRKDYNDLFVIDWVVCHLQIRSADLNQFDIISSFGQKSVEFAMFGQRNQNGIPTYWNNLLKV
jgi:hypothetical protein